MMGEAVRFQRRRAFGWKVPDGTVYVGRPTPWGNPFKPGQPSGYEFKDGGDPTPLIAAMSLEQCLEFYRSMATGFLSPEMHPHGHEHMKRWRQRYRHMSIGEAARAYLRGKNLSCWCPPGQPCHADILLELANPAIKAGGIG